MHKVEARLILCILLLVSGVLNAQTVERFEHLNTSDGLSQNSVLSILSDSKGYMWFGTMNGLNRYNGYDFEIYKVNQLQENSLTHNRISRIWEDERQVIWIETYDGYYHYFKPETEEFFTLPLYQKSFEEKNSVISCFEQATENEIWLGSTNSGAYYLRYDSTISQYRVTQFLSRGVHTITNNTVAFILHSEQGETWIGTTQGLNHFQQITVGDSISQASFNHYNVNYSFTVATELNGQLYFGTDNDGMVVYNSVDKQFVEPAPVLDELNSEKVEILKASRSGKLLVGTANNGFFRYDPQRQRLDHFLKNQPITKIYEDHQGDIWVNTDEFGVFRLESESTSLKKYILADQTDTWVDEERQYFFEDADHNLWIGFFGGLALFNRDSNAFIFYKNDPQVSGSISSNIVYCITQDQSGLLWVGTGHPNGGVDKVIMSNPAFRQVSPSQDVNEYSENVIRALYHDQNGYLWAGNKTGKVFIIPPAYQKPGKLQFANATIEVLTEGNIYSITQDHEGYLWLGSKAGGIFVSDKPISSTNFNYRDINFINYRHDPEDSLSLSHDNVYTVMQDDQNRIWIGTYGGGLNLVTDRNSKDLRVKRINTNNSTLSSDYVRQIIQDSKGRIWLATIFGLNLWNENSGHFSQFLFNPENEKSISYNDIIHIYEDSRNRMWFTTFGGGLNMLQEEGNQNFAFERYTEEDGLVNDAVFSVLEDQQGNLWLGTEKGISRLDPEAREFENFDRNNGLISENFSENTATQMGDYLLFGNNNGILVINPLLLEKSTFAPNIVLTNFQISNRNVNFRNPESPIDQRIETLQQVTLKHHQSSLSFEYAGLSYFAPSQNLYAFKLEGFDQEWNEVGNQRKATYTNLNPGRYEFKVKAANWDGTWNAEPRSLSITILPPWWETWWAYTIYLLAGTFIFLAIRRSYLRYYHLQNDLKVEKRVSEIKLRFFTNISHEIRTPLTLLLGPIEDIKNMGELPEAVNQRIYIMERNGKRMLQLVNQLLDFRRIQNKKMPLKVQEIELNGFLQEIIQNFELMIAQKDIDLAYDTNQEDIRVWVDAKKFDSVIFNLLSNALKFSKPGKTVLMKVDNTDSDSVYISIQDEGPGIDKTKKHLLFQRFSSLSRQDEETMSSSGIGLSLANEIVKLHKGEIAVDSEDSQGSCFTVKIRKGTSHLKGKNITIIRDEEAEILHQQILSDAPPEIVDQIQAPKKEKNFKVLIAEDNPEIVNYLTRILGADYHLCTAINGKDALTRLSGFHPDLIITDVMMPEMDGIEFTRILKESFETSHIPVIMLTAKSNLEDQIHGVESGAEAYILKPFNSHYLMAVIENFIRQRKTVAEKYLSLPAGKEEISSLQPKQIPEPGPVAITNKDEKFLEEIMQIVEENYQDPDFNVEKLVDVSYVSRTVFYNKIKGLTGLTPIEFLRQVRIKIAGRLIQESDYNISEIAFMTGFNNVKYFRQHFKATFGVTPQDYKEKVK